MSTTVGDYLIDRLHAWGVTRIYGYPGDGINGIMGALARRSGDARKLAMSMLKGDSRRGGAVKQTVKDMASTLLLGR